MPPRESCAAAPLTAFRKTKCCASHPMIARGCCFFFLLATVLLLCTHTHTHTHTHLQLRSACTGDSHLIQEEAEKNVYTQVRKRKLHQIIIHPREEGDNELQMEHENTESGTLTRASPHSTHTHTPRFLCERASAQARPCIGRGSISVFSCRCGSSLFCLPRERQVLPSVNPDLHLLVLRPGCHSLSIRTPVGTEDFVVVPTQVLH